MSDDKKMRCESCGRGDTGLPRLGGVLVCGRCLRVHNEVHLMAPIDPDLGPQERPPAAPWRADDTLSVWMERFAELLGCENHPSTIAVEIQQMRADLDRVPSNVARAKREARDAQIKSMRATAVNCGNSGTCAVAGWCKTSEEQTR